MKISEVGSWKICCVYESLSSPKLLINKWLKLKKGRQQSTVSTFAFSPKEESRLCPLKDEFRALPPSLLFLYCWLVYNLRLRSYITLNSEQPLLKWSGRENWCASYNIGDCLHSGLDLNRWVLPLISENDNADSNETRAVRTVRGHMGHHQYYILIIILWLPHFSYLFCACKQKHMKSTGDGFNFVVKFKSETCDVQWNVPI